MLLISPPCHLHTLILLHLLSSLSTMVSSTAYILIASLNSVLSFQSKSPTDSEPLQLHHMLGPPAHAKLNGDLPTELSPLPVSDLSPNIIPLFTYSCSPCLLSVCVSDNLKSSRNITALILIRWEGWTLIRQSNEHNYSCRISYKGKM